MELLISINCLIFVVIGMFGAVMHSISAWVKGRTEKPMDWLLINKRATVGTLTTSIGTILAAVADGRLNNIQDPVQVVAAFTFVYVIDSGFNNITQKAGAV